MKNVGVFIKNNFPNFRLATFQKEVGFARIHAMSGARQAGNMFLLVQGAAMDNVLYLMHENLKEKFSSKVKPFTKKPRKRPPKRRA